MRAEARPNHPSTHLCFDVLNTTLGLHLNSNELFFFQVQLQIQGHKYVVMYVNKACTDIRTYTYIVDMYVRT